MSKDNRSKVIWLRRTLLAALSCTVGILIGTSTAIALAAALMSIMPSRRAIACAGVLGLATAILAGIETAAGVKVLSR